MDQIETCDVCGGEVSAGEAVRAEVNVDQLMCPTAMICHPACYERAAELWEPDPQASCGYDPAFPETAQWAASPPRERTSPEPPPGR